MQRLAPFLYSYKIWRHPLQNEAISNLTNNGGFHDQEKMHHASIFFFILSSVTTILCLNLIGCSKEGDGVAPYMANEETENVNGSNDVITPSNEAGSSKANETNSTINIDSLTEAIKNEVTHSIKDSLNSANSPNENNIDTLTTPNKDSLNTTPSADSATNNQSITQTLNAEDGGIENIYGAFANHYALMYRDLEVTDDNGDTITVQSPFPITISNSCNTAKSLCTKRKVMVKTWISGFTDTATVTGVVPPADSILLFPNLDFNNSALLALTTAQKTQRQIKVYALENDNQILFHSESKPTTIHPMQVFGWDEPAFSGDELYAYLWYGVWVTPMADSITNIINEVAQKLPNGQIVVYQKYPQDSSLDVSTYRVIDAVFKVLQSRNIKYVENDGAGSFGQRINYPVETLRKKQGLCIETAVLFASILERLGYEVSIMLIPGHAFVGWLNAPQSNPAERNNFDVIETTMIGNKNVTIWDAVEAGIDRYYDPFGDGSFKADFVVNIPISILRKNGITPNNIP